MGIRTKVIGCSLVILSLFLTVSLVNYFRFRRANNRLLLVNELFLPLSRQIVQLQGNLGGLAEEMTRYYTSPNFTFDNSTFSRMAKDLYPYVIQKKMNSMEHLLSKFAGADPGNISSELTHMVGVLRQSFDELLRSTGKAGFESSYMGLRSHLQNLSKKVDEECQRITLAAQAEGRENLVASSILSLFVSVFGVISILLSHRILKPLPVLIGSIQKMADGDFHQSLKINARDNSEIALLAREVNRMLSALRERDKKIRDQQSELLQSERLAAASQLSAEVVHEIRNPLNSICLNMDWLEEQLKGSSPDISKTIQSIAREIERLNQIAEGYLVRSRVASEGTQKTPVNELIREILDFSREEDRSRHIEVEVGLSPQELLVKSDRARLKQAFLNVFKNAREAMPQGGKLKVETSIKGNVYQIRFCDTGYGMNEGTRQKTFSPFFTTKPNGTGLGLTLTKAIVEEAQGTIHFESQVGKGTTFILQFPV